MKCKIFCEEFCKFLFFIICCKNMKYTLMYTICKMPHELIRAACVCDICVYKTVISSINSGFLTGMYPIWVYYDFK